MKKIVAVILTLLMMFTFAACTQAESAVYTVNWGKTDVNERSLFKVTIEKPESVSNEEVALEGAPILSGEGEYEMILTGSAKSGYTLDTTFSFVGEYTLVSGEKVPVDDKIVTTATFKDVIYNQKPTYSKREYDGKTVVFENGEYDVKPLKYSTEITYGEKKADIKTGQGSSFNEPIGNIPNNFSISLPTGIFFDNEQLMYGLRSIVKKSGLASSFQLVSGLSTATIPMTAQISNGTVKEDSKINGEEKKLDCYMIRLAKSTTEEAGSPILLHYISEDMGMISGHKQEVDRSRLFKIEQVVPFSNTLLVYELTEYSYGEKEQVAE